jgi:hypothetical protein
MEKNPSCINFGSVDTHNKPKITQRLLRVSWSMGLSRASPMQWKHVILDARVPKHLHCVKII